MKIQNKLLSLFLCLLIAVCPLSISFATAEKAVITLASPVNETVSFHTELMEGYLNQPYTTVSDFANGVEELSKPEAVTFNWDAIGNADNYTLSISESKDFENEKTYITDNSTLNIYNLKINTEYYWKVVAQTGSGEISSETAVFETSSTAPRNLNVDGMTNVRDIGGYVTTDGAFVKQNMLIRCARLNESNGTVIVTKDGEKTLLSDLGIKTELDLRMASNGENTGTNKSALGDEVNYVAVPLDYHGNMLEGNFTEDNQGSIRKIFEILSDENNYPVIFHCSIGTDRTGMLAYMLEGLLSVSETDMIRDYLLSNFGNIGGSRSLNGIRKGYCHLLKSADGDTLSEKITSFLVKNINVPKSQIDSFIKINKEYRDCQCDSCKACDTAFAGKVSVNHIPSGSPVSSESDFLNMIPDGKYYLTKDITLSKGYTPAFYGTLDGNGYSVTVNTPLFNNICGSLVNLTLNGNINAKSNSLLGDRQGSEIFGAVASVAGDCYIKNVVNNADINAHGIVGGFVGKACGRCKILSCINQGDVSATCTASGFVAENSFETTLSRCENSGNITSNNPFAHTFAFVGASSENVFVEKCNNSGNIDKAPFAKQDLIGKIRTSKNMNSFCGNTENGEYVYICDCNKICHQDGLLGLIWKPILLIIKLFDPNGFCECGMLYFS